MAFFRSGSTTPGSPWRGAGQEERSPPASSRRLPAAARPREGLVAEALALFGLPARELDPRIPPAIAHAGADHLVLALRERTVLASMHYDFEVGRNLAQRDSIGTFSLIHAESPRRFHARNPFPIGGVFEDPATGLPLRPSPDTCAISAGRMAERSRSFRAKTWVCHLAFGSR